MAKKNKTRQQKIIADLRRQIYASQIKYAPLDKKIEKVEHTHTTSLSKIEIPAYKQPAVAFTNTYPYLIKDLEKTALLTVIIIAAQFIFLFILKNHLIVFPGLTY